MESVREVKVYVGAGHATEALRDKLNEDSGSRLLNVATRIMEAKLDGRAVADEVVVEDIHVDPAYPQLLSVEMTITWSLYHGCRDMNQADDENVCEDATYTKDGHLVFRVLEPRRPPSDC